MGKKPMYKCTHVGQNCVIEGATGKREKKRKSDHIYKQRELYLYLSIYTQIISTSIAIERILS